MTDEPRGVGRCALGLIPELTALAPGHQFVVVRHESNRWSGAQRSWFIRRS